MNDAAPARRSPPLLRGLMLGVLLLAFFVRVYHLDYQSFWSDEGISLLRASRPMGEMLRDMPVEHAPGYFVGLNGWLRLTGTSDFAIRFFSLWPSVLAVALTYRWLLELGGRRRWAAAAAATTLLATNAFQVAYAEEARMYSWLLAAGLIATWMLPKVLGTGFGEAEGQGSRMRWGAWIAYVLSTAVCIYLHHFGFLVPTTHTLFVLIWLAATRDPRGFLRWAAAGVAVLLLYTVWLPRFLGIFGFSGWRTPQSPWAIPWRYWTAYTVGDAMPEPLHWWLPWVYLALAVLGLIAWGRTRRMGGLLLALSAAVPIVGAVALALRQPDYHERYTIMASAPVIMLAAVGLFPAWSGKRAALWQSLGILGLVGLVGANALALQRLYTDAILHKPDFRAAAQRIRALEAPGDVILIDGPDPEKVFLHYYDGDARVVDLRALEGKSDAEADAALSEATHDAARAWGLLYFHAPGPVQAWLARNGWPAAETLHNGIFVTLYGLSPDDHNIVAIDSAPAQDFGSALRLAGTTATCENSDNPDGVLACPAGELLRVTTIWEVREPPASYRFSLRLVDDAGRVWAAEDYTPGDGFTPTESWQTGVTQTDRRGLLLPADLPPGDYRVTLRLYDPATGEAITTEAGPDVTLAGLTVTPAIRPINPEALGIAHPVDRAPQGSLRLLGVAAAPGPLHSGQPGELSVWWQVESLPINASQVEIALEGPNGVIGGGLHPLSETTASWMSGQIVRERYPVMPDAAAPTGEYRLRVALRDDTGAELGQPWDAGRLAVEARPRAYRLPRMNQRTDVNFGEAVALRGYDVTSPVTPGAPIELTLYWQAKDRVTAPYKVFVHLVDAAGNLVAQSDAFPASGAAPTESWLPREVVVDRHELRAPGPGAYQMYVGLYDPVSGARLPATDANGAQIPNDAALLTTVTVR